MHFIFSGPQAKYKTSENVFVDTFIQSAFHYTVNALEGY